MPAPANVIQAVAGRLTGSAELAALVGTRVWPTVPAKNPAAPYVVYYRTGGGGGPRLGGAARVKEYSVRVDCWAATQGEADAVLAVVVALLDGWRDRPAGVHGCFAQDDQDEALSDDAGGSAYQTGGQTFNIWFRG